MPNFFGNWQPEMPHWQQNPPNFGGGFVPGSGLGGLMQQYIAAGNPAIGSEAWRELRQQGQHPFMDWWRSQHPNMGLGHQFPVNYPPHANGNTGIVPPHMQPGIAPGEYNPSMPDPRPMYPNASPMAAPGMEQRGRPVNVSQPQFGGLADLARRPTPYSPR